MAAKRSSDGTVPLRARPRPAAGAHPLKPVVARCCALGLALVLVVLLTSCGVHVLSFNAPASVAGRYGAAEIVHPSGTARALVVMFPDNPRSMSARQIARQLAHSGAWVTLIDTDTYRASFATRRLPCSTMAEDAERLARKLLDREGGDVFLPPLLVGDGTGAALVRQTSASAASGVLAGAVVRKGPDGGAKADCIPVASAGHATPVFELVAGSSDREVADAVIARFASVAGRGVAALPLVELPVPGSHRLAIVVSGDGGWRELDQGISAALNRQGVSVVGLNSLRYFWKEKTPQQLADDLALIVGEYQKRWQADDVGLIGYSFGADVLPFAYPRLPAEQRRDIHFISLLGLAHGAAFEVRIGGWLGWGRWREQPVQPQLAGLRPVAVQCIYGAEEKDSLCRELHVQIADVVERPGGHHFDRDPVALARIILRGWQQANSTQDKGSSTSGVSTRSCSSPSANRACRRSPGST